MMKQTELPDGETLVLMRLLLTLADQVRRADEAGKALPPSIKRTARQIVREIKAQT